MQPLTARTETEDGAQPKRAMRRDEDLAPPPEIDRARLLRRVGLLVLLAALAVAVISLVPGLSSLRSRFTHAHGGWLAVGAVLKLLSGVCYVIAFREVFCRRMSWRASAQIGFSELGANAVLPVGGAGGLALGAWALRRGGMDAKRIARRSVAFFFLTSVPNVVGVVILGVGMSAGAFGGTKHVAATLVPAVIAAAAVLLTLAGGRWAAAAERRLRSAGRSRWAAVMEALAGGVGEAVSLLREARAALLVGLVGYLAFDVMLLWSCFHAFGGTPSLAVVWIGYLIGELGGLIPIPGGIGGIELGVVGALVLYGAHVGAASAAVLGYRAIGILVPVIVGLAAFAVLRRTLAHEALAISCCEPGGEVHVLGLGAVQLNR